MLKKSLLLTLLLALLVPWAVAQQSLPYSYGFEDNNLSIDGWTTQNPSGLNASEFGINASAAKTGSYGFRFSSYNDNGTSTQYLISPELTAPKGVTVSFYYKSSSTYSSGEKFKVGYSTTNTDVSSFSWSDEYSTSSTNWSQLPEFNCPAGTKYIAIYYYANYQYRLYIDDISLDVPPSCMKPTGLTATLTPGDGTVATLDWTAGGEETAWVLEYGTTSDFTGATSVNVSGTPTKNLKGLTAETKYYARVKADCGGGDTSEWSATCEFTPTNLLYINILGSSSSTTNYLPTQTNYDYSYTQQIYTAEEMGSFPCTLKSVAFKGNKAAVCDLDIYLANTTKSSFTGTSDYIAISEATLVFSGNVTFTANDWTTIEFDNEFDYEGGNLAVIVDDNSGNYDYGSTKWQTFNTTTAQALYFYQDDTNINPSSPSGSSSGTPTLKNQIKLGYALPSPYQKPKNLAVTNLTATTATITWEAPNSDVQSYKYQYKEEGGEWSALTSTTALSAPLTVLTGNTTYNFQVQAIYAGNNESAFASTSFTTPCDAFSIDPTAYQYGFETAADMDCWALVNGVTNTAVWDNATIDYNFGYEPARTGDYCFMFFYVDYDDTDPEYQTLISPELTDIPANGVHVEFYYVKDLGGSGAESFRVGYSTTDKNLSSFTWGTEITNASTEYQRFSANYPQGTKYVAVQHTSDDQYYLFLDDFTFEGAADCIEPSSVLADNITTTGASINWTAGGEEVAWDIYVTDDATIVPDDGTTPTYANISTKPYPLTPLTPATTYYVYVRAACKGTETSAWSTPAIFHTECEGMDLPYGPYGFEDGALSVCWNVINTNTSYNSASVSNSNPNTGTFSLSFFRGSTTGDLVAVLPEVGAYDLSDYQFEFSAMGGYAGYEITIGIMTDPDNLTTFVAQGDVITTTTSYAEHKVRFNEYTGSGKYVAIKVVRPSTVTYGSIYVDDIAINPIPSCIEPSGLAVSDETGHGATFSWTNGGSETEWHLYVSTENNAPADDIDLGKVTVADSNPFTMITGLDPETEYYVWVRANCGGTDGYSAWVGPETFTTEVACPAPTGLAASEITGHTAKLSWDGTSNSYNVWYRTAEYNDGSIVDEDFTGLTSGIPTGWDNSEGTMTNNSYKWNYYATGHEGVGLRFDSYNASSGQTNFLKTPSMDFPAGKTMQLSFWWKNPKGGDFSVYISTDGGTTKTPIVEGLTSQSTWKQETFNLTDYIGANNVTIHFKGTSNWGNGDAYIYLDEVQIGEAVPAGTWTTKTTDASPYTATGLLAETKYEAQVQGNCGSEGTSQWTSSVFFTTDIACPAPTALAASNPTSSSFDLQWTNGGSEDWVLAYKVDGAADFTELDLNVSDVTEEAGTISYTLGGLDAETDYIVKVRDNCEASVPGDGVSAWTAEVTYSTIAACSALNPVVSEITHYTATVNFEGESASGFTVKYREAAYIDGIGEEFSGTSVPTDWTLYTGMVDNVIAGTATLASTNYGWTMTTSTPNVFNSNHIRLNIYGTSRNHWLVTPEIDLAANSGLSFDLALTAYSSYGTSTSAASGTCDDERFVVLIYANDAWSILREWNNSGSSDVYNDIATAGENVQIDLSSYSGTVKIAFYGESTTSGNGDNDMHLDNVIIGVTVPAATTWHTQAATGTTANLSGLTAGTKYDVKVVPNCDPTQESGIVSFSTLKSDKKYFLTAGNWGTASNWMDSEIPGETDNVIIRANVNVEPGCVAMANNITFEGATTPTITIKDGGQLKHTNAVTATLQRDITGYGNDPNVADGWYLIATPVSSTYITTNFSGTFDLYKYNEPDYMWYTWNSTTGQSFNYLYRNTGYLYAHDTDTQLSFTGEMMGTKATTSKSLSYTSSLSPAHDDVIGFNLIGNPFTRNLVDGDMTIGGGPLTSYYVINPDGDALVQVNSDAYQIKPGEGFFVQAGGTGQSVVFNPSSKDAFNVAYIKIVAGNEDGYDNACIQIEEGNTLRKMNIAKKTSVYVIDNGDDYAAATIHELAGTMPVHFKAVKEGEYEITVNTKNLEATTLLLFDNFKNETIDLLETPTYSFKSSADDPENRFKLIFDFNNNNYNGVEDNFTSEIFVYQSGDELIVNGEGELQIFDVLGRLVTSKNISGIERVSKPAQTGVYIFRLNEHTQKLIIK